MAENYALIGPHSAEDITNALLTWRSLHNVHIVRESLSVARQFLSADIFYVLVCFEGPTNPSKSAAQAWLEDIQTREDEHLEAEGRHRFSEEEKNRYRSFYVSRWGLSVRQANALTKWPYYTPEQILELSEDDLGAIRNLGVQFREKIQELKATKNLQELLENLDDN